MKQFIDEILKKKFGFVKPVDKGWFRKLTFRTLALRQSIQITQTG